MWLFVILVGLGLVFLLYVLIQFFRDTKPETSTLQRGSDPKDAGISLKQCPEK